ncbi:MAG: hypothetical protein QOJ15_9067 [Bradyrhizobium sp.]|nr:hypothetical protein [Bradyrhizobium sp.]
MEDHVAQPTAPEAPIVTRRPLRRRQPTAPETPAALEAPAAPIVIPRARRRLKIAVSLVVVVAGLLLLLYGQEVAENVYPPATRAGDDLAQVKQALQQERDKTDKLTADLAQIKQALQQESDKTDKLARELNTGLAQATLAARPDATPGRSRNATGNLSDTPDPTQAPATDKPAPTLLPTSETLVMPAGDKPATMATRPTAPDAPGNLDAARLMARASVLLGQGNIGPARTVLERAAETGSAPALFALAETYDPIILSTWGTFGTQGDVAKAQELYGKAFAGGVQEARDRLNALH